MTPRQHLEHEISRLLETLDALETEADRYPERPWELAVKQDEVSDELKATVGALRALRLKPVAAAPTAEVRSARQLGRLGPVPGAPPEPSASRYLP